MVATDGQADEEVMGEMEAMGYEVDQCLYCLYSNLLTIRVMPDAVATQLRSSLPVPTC
jgi:hypothetical protein